MTRVYYKEAVGCVIAFDISNVRSFQAVTKWKNDLDLKVHLANDLCIPCVLLANKVRGGPASLLSFLKGSLSFFNLQYDLKNKAVTSEEIDKLCKELNFIAWFPTSAKENLNVGPAMDKLLQEVFAAGVFNPPKPLSTDSEMVDMVSLFFLSFLLFFLLCFSNFCVFPSQKQTQKPQAPKPQDSHDCCS